MALDPKYVISPNLQEVFFDVRTGELMSGGTVVFYSDINRANKKSVYSLQGNEANYTFTPLPNPITLNSLGMPVDNAGNVIRIYYYPWMDTNASVQELYYIKVFNNTGSEQFTRQAWPGNEQSGGGTISSTSQINLIPNGQLLAHTDLPNNALIGGVNVIAQGGFEVVLDPSPTSINTYEFMYTQPSNIPQDPRYVGVLTASSPNPAENLKNFRVKFRDVNKFLNTSGTIYQFAFWAISNVQLTATINVLQDFGTGGSDEIRTPITSIEILTSGNQLYNASIDFSSLPTGTLGLLDDDFVAIEIALPRDIPFSFQHTDFVMLASEVPLSAFPIQTDADMLSRGVAGWMDIPNPDGSDLYLPLVLTRQGMTFDHGIIGKIEASSGRVPATSDPTAYTNDMPCDGSTYISSQYSALGIPYSRLSNYLLTGSIGAYPIYGTGDNYATGWSDISDPNSFYISTNIYGTPIGGAQDSGGGTGFTFDIVPTYSGAQVGTTQLYTLCSWNPNGFFQAFQYTNVTNSVSQSGTSICSSLSVSSNVTGLMAEQNLFGFSGIANNASTFASSGNCNWISFVIGSTTYTIYYRVNNTGAIAGGPGGIVYIIDVPTGCLASQVAQLTSYVLQSLQITRITTAVTVPTSGQYFTFQANPASIRTIQPWYAYDVNDTPPAPAVSGAELIQVLLPTPATRSDVATATYTAINSYQFAAPDLRGMFLRGNDSSSIYDADRLYRFNQGLGFGGAEGTYEQQQLLAHNHAAVSASASNAVQGNTVTGMNNAFQSSAFNSNYATTTLRTAVIQTSTTTTISNTGGTETRPINSYVNWVIKY